MKVLHFYKTYYPDTFGGVEQVIYQICEGASSLGIESEVLAISNSERSESIIGTHRAHYCRPNFELLSTPFSLPAVFKLRELAKTADIVHYHFPWPFMDMAHFISRHKKPTVVTYHSDIVRQKNALKAYRTLMRRFLADSDRIIATSPNYLNSSETLSEFREKVSTIPIGLDRSTYPAASEKSLSHWRSTIPEKFFLFIGVLRYYKGLDFLLRAAKNLNYPIVIVGSGPEEDQLKKLSIKLGLNNVYFLGSISDADKVSLLTLSYAAVFPSHLRAEAFGISLLEAAMFGKPMISCEIGTGTSYINTNDTGLIVEPENVEALRGAMQYLWDNPEIAKSKGSAALKRFTEIFTAKQMAEKYVEVYKSLYK